MISIFQVASGDLSLNYLYSVFGSVNNVITCSSNCPTGPSLNLLGTIFQLFNACILTIAIIMAVYFTIVGVVSTAHEGEFMGKKYNNIWIPIRMVMGIALMVPTTSGFSLIQVIMMWVIVQGVGMADSVWSTALNEIGLLGSPYAQVSAPGSSTQAAIAGLFAGLVCDESSKIPNADPQGINPQQSSYCSQGGNTSYCGNKDTSFVAYTGGATSSSLNSQMYNSVTVTTSGTTYTAKPAYILGPPIGACGALIYCNQDSDPNDTTGACSPGNPANSANPSGAGSSLACKACQAQIQALQAIIPTLTSIAQTYAQADYQYRNFYANTSNQGNGAGVDWINTYCSQGANPALPKSQCCIPVQNDTACEMPFNPGNYSQFPGPSNSNATTNVNDAVTNQLIWPYAIAPISNNTDFIASAVNEYQSQIGAAITAYYAPLLAQSNSSGTQTNSQLSAMETSGWIKAGAYYFTLASMNGSNMVGSIPTINMLPPNPSISASGNPVVNYRNNYTAASTLMSAASGGAMNSGVLGGAPGGEQTSQTLSSLITSAQSANSQASNSGSNPMASLISQGQAMLISVEVAYPAMLAIMMIAGAVALIEPIVLGTGITQDPAEGVITAINTYFMPVFFMLLGILLFYGGLMSIYIPLIPFVIFTTSAIGWFISVVEALVAGPIVALGIMSPGGQHEFLGKAEGGAMMLFAVFLKPSLMIVGMFVGMLLSSVMVGMVNSFWGTITGSFSSGDPIGFFMLLGAKIMLTIAVISKCFSAIYVLPNQILTWMGGPAGHEQGGEALGEVKGGQEKVGAQVTGAGEKHGSKAAGEKDAQGKTGGIAGATKAGVNKGRENVAASKPQTSAALGEIASKLKKP